MNAERIFDTERSEGVLFVVLHGEVGSLADADVIGGLEGVIAELAGGEASHVVVDFVQTDYFGSSLLEALRRLGHEVDRRGRRMALCNLSPVGLEIVRLVKFDELWPIESSRDEALETIRRGSSD